jgi:hypothetical protein
MLQEARDDFYKKLVRLEVTIEEITHQNIRIKKNFINS